MDESFASLVERILMEIGAGIGSEHWEEFLKLADASSIPPGFVVASSGMAKHGLTQQEIALRLFDYRFRNENEAYYAVRFAQAISGILIWKELVQDNSKMSKQLVEAWEMYSLIIERLKELALQLNCTLDEVPRILTENGVIRLSDATQIGSVTSMLNEMQFIQVQSAKGIARAEKVAKVLCAAVVCAEQEAKPPAVGSGITNWLRWWLMVLLGKKATLADLRNVREVVEEHLKVERNRQRVVHFAGE